MCIRDRMQIVIPALESVKVEFSIKHNKKLLENDSETERIELTMQIAQKRRRSRAVCLFSALDELHDVHNIESVSYTHLKTTKLLKEMCQKGVITVEGKGKGTKYIIS